jgi:hypothetical protein
MEKMSGLIFFILSTLSSSKRRGEKNEKLSFVKTNYFVSQLGFDRYFAHELYWVLIFCQNGIVIHSKIDSSNLSEFESKLTNGIFYSKIKNDNTCWRLYKLIANKVNFELLATLSQITCKEPFIHFGDLSNDLTKHISRNKHINGKEVEPRSDTFHIKQFSPKPDSTNSFIN